MSQQKGFKFGRLAMRQEGGFWNAYHAESETMEDAHLLGSIKMTLVMGNHDRKQEFMDLMRECQADLIEKITGIRPFHGGEVSAPEHERAGNA